VTRKRRITTGSPPDLRVIAPGLLHAAEGYWIVPERAAVSYPASGNDFFDTLEEESFWFSHRSRAIAAAVRRYPPANGPIFDLGAGNGHVSRELQRAGFTTIAIEPDRAGAANAVRKGIEPVVCGSLPSSAFRARTAGAIGLFDVLEHVEDDRGFLQALRPYLQPGGRLYVTVPAYQWLWSDTDAASYHSRRYTLASLSSVLDAAGYGVEYSTYFFWCLPLPIWLLRTLPSRLRRRPAQSFARAFEHRLGARRLRQVAEWSVAFEQSRIARGASIPFGGSCLIVGQLRNAD
jgi:SAM-dependent methyltransferase